MSRYNRTTPSLDYDTWVERVGELASTLCPDPSFDGMRATTAEERRREWICDMGVELAAHHWGMLWYDKLAENLINGGDGEDSTPEWFAQARALLCNALRVQVDMLDTKVAEWRASNTPPWAAYWWIAELVNLAVE